MKILALDTSTIACSCAIWDGETICESYVIAPREHPSRLLAMVEELLAQAKLKFKDLDGLAFVCGPGSFTGLRIAASFTQGLAMSTNLPVLAISSLATMAQGAYRLYGATQVFSAIDARMQEVYWGEYILNTANACMQLVGAERVVAPADISLTIQPTTNIFGVGSGWGTYADALLAKVNLNKANIDGAFYPHAQDMIPLAKLALAEGKMLSAEQALPIYLRNNVAQVST